MLSASETGRQLLHLIFGLLMVAAILYGFLDKVEMLVILAVGILVSFISRKYRLPLISWFLDKFERAEVRSKFPGKGVVYFFAGATLAMLLFEKDVAMASIVILSLGDSIAPLVGQFGRIRHPLSSDKFIEGVVAGAVAASFGAMLFVNPLEAVSASVLAMIAEGVNIIFLGEKLDDNIVIPIVSGGVITALRLLAL